MCEGGLRVRLMMRWKGKLKPGVTFDLPVSRTDIFATVVPLTSAVRTANIDGVDWMPYLNGKESGAPHEVLFWRQGH